jgi:ABC-type dipeptide/oligopeptide/nickel transport system ATPase component
MGSIPAMDEERERLLQIDGAMPRLNAIPAGCAFNPRCPRAFAPCYGRASRPDGGGLDAGRLLAARADLAGGRVSAALVQVEGLAKTFDVSLPWLNRVAERKPASSSMRSTTSPSRSAAAARSPSSANRAAARARWRACSSASMRRRAAASSSTASSPAPAGSGRRRSGVRMQMIFQDPYASLNPRWKVKDIVAEPLREHGFAAGEGRAGKQRIADRVGELLVSVGLTGADAEKFPHQFSGGQRQRVSIARRSRPSPSSWSATSRPRRSTSRCRRRSSTS